MSWRGYRFMGTLTQWLSSNQWLGTWDGTLPDTAVILKDQAEGHLLHQMNYIVAQLNIPRQSLSGSTGDVDWTLGSADDHLSSDNRLGWEGRWDFVQSGVDGHWTGQTLTVCMCIQILSAHFLLEGISVVVLSSALEQMHIGIGVMSPSQIQVQGG